jgi:uncharacterized protein (DUF2249 family)
MSNPTRSTAPSPTPVVDIRALAWDRRASTLRSTIAGLPSGGSVILVHDDDPRPLRNPTIAGQGVVGWEYLEDGPTLWRVRISRVA